MRLLPGLAGLLLCTVLSSCAGCSDAKTATQGTLAGVDWSADENPLHFPLAWVGETSSRKILLHNGTKAPRTVHLQTASPFDAPADVLLAPDELRAADLHFAPQEFGNFEGTVTLSVEGEKHDLGLLGESRRKPTCTPSDSCHASTPNLATGNCIDTALPNETACDAPCISNGFCVDGACVGPTRSCDDGDACTTDSCDSATGCAHKALQCADSATDDLCHVPICDPSTGCGLVAVADGTSCGRRGCDVQDVCISGSCVEQIPSDGASCGYPSPCQPLGVCQAQVCQRPFATLLEPEWTYEVGSGASFHYSGLLDGDGNLILSGRESPNDTWWIDTVSPEGQRIRHHQVTAIPTTVSVDPEMPVAVVDGRVLTDCPGQRRIIQSELCARDATTGALLWKSDLSGAFPKEVVNPNTSDPTFAAFEKIMRGDPKPPGELDILVQLRKAADSESSFWPQAWYLATIRLGDGAVQKLVKVETDNPNTWVFLRDDAGNFYGASSEMGNRTFSLGADGKPRWTGPSSSSWGAPQAIAYGSLLETVQPNNSCFQATHPRGRDSASGTSTGISNIWLSEATWLPVGKTSFAVGWPGTISDAQCPDTTALPYLFRLNPETAATESSTLFDHPGHLWLRLGALTPTTKKTLLFLASTKELGEEQTYLGEWGLDGAEHFLCQLDAPAVWGGRPWIVVTRGHVVVRNDYPMQRLDAFALPGYEAAAPPPRGP